MAKKILKTTDGTKRRQSVKKKIKKLTPLKPKISTSSKFRQRLVKPLSVIKVKIKPTSKKNDLVSHSVSASEEEKMVKKYTMNNNLSPGSDRTSSHKKQLKSSVKPKITKTQMLQLTKSEDENLQQREMKGAGPITGNSRKCVPKKKNIEVTCQAASNSLTLSSIGVKSDNSLESDTTSTGKQINKKSRMQIKNITKINVLNADVNRKKQAFTTVHPADATEDVSNLNEMHEHNIMRNQTERNFSPILSYLSLTAKPAISKEDSKCSSNYSNTPSVSSGFTSIFSHTTSLGYCVPINGKVPIIQLDDIKNNMTYDSKQLINLNTKPQNEEITSQIPDTTKSSIHNGSVKDLGENMMSCFKVVSLSSNIYVTNSLSDIRTSESNFPSSENSKIVTTKNIVNEADLEKVQNILQNIDFSWIDEIDKIIEGNNYIKENCKNIMSLSQCMSTDKDELKVACKNIQDTLDMARLPKTDVTLQKTEITNVRSVDNGTLKYKESVPPNHTTIPAQTYISSDFINLDDDIISLYAESLGALDLNTVFPKKPITPPIKLPLPSQVRNIKPTVKTQTIHTFTKSNEISAISSTVTHPTLDNELTKVNVQKLIPAETVDERICKKQSADSTSVLRDNKCTDSETNSYSDVQENMSEVLTPQKQIDMTKNCRNDLTSDEIPCSTIPNRDIHPNRYMPNKTFMSSINTNLSGIVFAGVCFRNLRYSCTNERCQHSHRILSPADINTRLSAVGTETCIHGYLLMKRHKVLCDRYLMVFVHVFASRKLSKILFEIMIDIMCGKIVSNTFESMLLCLDELNTLDITEYEDIFLHSQPDKGFFSETLILFILRSGYFLKYVPVLTKLVALFFKNKILLQNETVKKFVQVICATVLRLEHKQFLKLIYKKCVKNTDNRIFSTISLTDWDVFGQRLVQVELNEELEDLWLEIKPFIHTSETCLLREQFFRPPLPNSLTPVATEPGVSNVNNKLRKEKRFINPFVQNHRSYKLDYSQRNYTANRQRVEEPPQKKWVKNTMRTDMRFPKNIHANSRFVTFGGAPRLPNPFMPPG